MPINQHFSLPTVDSLQDPTIQGLVGSTFSFRAKDSSPQVPIPVSLPSCFFFDVFASHKKRRKKHPAIGSMDSCFFGTSTLW